MLKNQNKTWTLSDYKLLYSLIFCDIFFVFIFKVKYFFDCLIVRMFF